MRFCINLHVYQERLSYHSSRDTFEYVVLKIFFSDPRDNLFLVFGHKVMRITF